LAQRNPYKHYLRYFDGTDWYYHTIDNTGAYFANVTPTEIQRAPEGWQEYEIGWERGFTYYGMFTTYATPLKFHKDGAKILRYLLYNQGIEAKCELYVEKFNPDTYAYDLFFRGDLDFSQAQDEFDYVVVPVMENGFAAKLKAREHTPYEFAIDGNPDVQYVYDDGLLLQAKINWEGVAGQNFDFFPDLTYIDSEGTNVSIKFYEQNYGSGGPNSTFLQNTSGSSVDIELKCDFNFLVTTGIGTADANAQLLYGLYPIGSPISSYYYILNSSFTHHANVSHIYAGTDTQTITVPDGYGLVFLFRMEIIGGGGLVIPSGDYSTNVYGIDLAASFTNRFAATYTPHLYVKDVFIYLIKQISAPDVHLGVPDPDLTINTTWFDTVYTNQLAVSSGDGIKGLSGSKLRTTFADFFKFMNTEFGVAFVYDKVSNTVDLVFKTDVFKTSVSPYYPKISSVVNFKATPFTQESWSTLNIGSGTYSYDQKGDGILEITNGKDEFNNTQTYLSSLVRIQKTADYVSPWRCDMYGREFERINYSGKTISDSQNDNDVFALHINDDNSNTYTDPVTGNTINYHLIHRDPIVPGVWEIFNIFSPDTAYNILFSPKRSLVRNGDYFRACFKLNDNDYFNFQLSGKNNVGNLKMYTETLGFIDYNEGEAIQIAQLCPDGAELFQPVIFEFETNEQINLYNLIESDPYSFIEIVYLGVSYYGYILSVSTRPAMRGNAKFKMLATNTSIGTDLTNLIR